MFIELADHLRCPAAHDESFLVLLPDRMDARSVREGQLGCPVCGRIFPIRDGEFNAGGTEELPSGTTGPAAVPDGAALATLAGLGGPGGYLVLTGSAAGGHESLAAVLPGVALVAANPPAGVADAGTLSVVRGGRLPLKSSSMRGVVLGKGYGMDARWIAEALRVTLSGLRVVGAGEPPRVDDLEILASAGGWWVGSKIRNRM